MDVPLPAREPAGARRYFGDLVVDDDARVRTPRTNRGPDLATSTEWRETRCLLLRCLRLGRRPSLG